ncbi:hypothetical protein SK571_00525 [Lentzea sp. BCCO 10_0798]|uniref:Uncharacterized protein n=1 Tax=Lentzea kristufekii TaxID=3095430 RepID=A0ABU4TIW0_9PSEU|nr:hypothetical protein [Lentzea sp. BCCO 10_0798]MDX8047851.1 hypothetical protein [Lentzea sp. BCCO 10_0798]
MVPVWVAVLGIVGTLAAAVLTQILTNRREFQRDQLKWAQERQQRVLDQQTALLAESLTAITRWFDQLHTTNEHMSDPHERKGRPQLLPELEEAAMSAVASVKLLCSDDAIRAADLAVSSLLLMSYNIDRAWDDNEAGIDASVHVLDIDNLRTVYRAELARLAAEPVVLPKKALKAD